MSALEIIEPRFQDSHGRPSAPGTWTTRFVPASELPLRLGGPNSDVRLFEETRREAAFLGWVAPGRFFVQSASGLIAGEGADVFVREQRLDGSRWVEPGDWIRIGDTLLHFEAPSSERASLALRLEERVSAGQGVSKDQDESASAERLRPDIPVLSPPAEDPDQPFRPRSISSMEARGFAWSRVLLLAGLLALLAAAVWLLGSRSIQVAITPTPDEVVLEGGPHFGFQDRTILRPGTYTVRAQKQGYAPLEESFEVTRSSDADLSFVLEPLPGEVTVDTGGIAGPWLPWMASRSARRRSIR